MPIFSDSFRTTYPTTSDDPFKVSSKGDLDTDPTFEDLDFGSPTMAGSPGPFIKNEPEDWQGNGNNNANNNGRFFSPTGFDMQQQQQFGNQNFGNGQGEFNGVNPNDLQMNNSNFNNQFSSHNMSSNFIVGNSGITDDELLDLNTDMNGHGGNFQNGVNEHNQRHFSHDSSNNNEGLSLDTSNGHMNNMYSSTPDGAPIQSPFINGFNYAQMQQEMQGGRQSFQGMTPGSMQSGSFARKQMPHGLERQRSDQRTPMTPKTAGFGNLHIGTPESSSFSSHHVMGQMGHRHQKSASSQWDNTPGSAQSWIDSPNQSPLGTSMQHHPQISGIIASGKHASLPTKVETPHTNYQTQEQKRRKRRESHNQVERRRRDNINERIQDLSKLVPQHRLEDEKVRKHIHNNGPLSPSIAASGSITQGLPIDDKEKGPNKGDILNGAVSWTRDLMWAAYLRLQREEELKNVISELGGTWPFEPTEEERRMRTEIVDAVEKNGWDKFGYSRGPGSGLRVPKHTNVAGDAVPNPVPEQELNPTANTGGQGGSAQFWMNQSSGSNSGNDAFTLKEEDEFGMEMS